MRAALREAMEPFNDPISCGVLGAGQDLEVFNQIMDWSTIVHDWPMGVGKRGQRVVIWTETDGLGGCEHVYTVLRRGERIHDPVHLMISGGDPSEATRNNRPAIQMYEALKKRGLNADGSQVSIDGFSRNTGHQGRILAGWLKALNAETVGVVAPLYHITRFLLTLGYACKNFAQIQPTFIPLPFGTWETRHASKEPYCETGDFDRVLGFTYAELCFSDKLGRFHLEDTGAENTSEVTKITEGWNLQKKLLCHHLTPPEAVDFFRLE